MIVEIDQRSDVPIYEQLHRQFIAAIAGDELSPGDSLPSVRSLAVDLGINLHTVNKAYALLRDKARGGDSAAFLDAAKRQCERAYGVRSSQSVTDGATKENQGR